MRAYRGKVLKPEKMTLKQLKSYIDWATEYLDWCTENHDKVNKYDRMGDHIGPYILELENRFRKKKRVLVTFKVDRDNNEPSET